VERASQALAPPLLVHRSRQFDRAGVDRDYRIQPWALFVERLDARKTQANQPLVGERARLDG
jgi:hypothetical protein